MTELRYGAGVTFTLPNGLPGNVIRWFETERQRDLWLIARVTRPDADGWKSFDRDDCNPFRELTR